MLLIRVAQDYIINPHVMGGAVGLSPLIVMTNAIAVTTLFGPFYVLLSVPIASLIVTIVDVAVRERPGRGGGADGDLLRQRLRDLRRRPVRR